MTDTESTEFIPYRYLPSWEYLDSALRDVTLYVLLFVNLVLLTVVIVELGIDDSRLAPGISMMMNALAVVAIAWMVAKLGKKIKNMRS